ncbi:hypothetical protein SPBR_04287 [Sporothrix brasiliensis 5110]|uniref:Protein kinase domain-containing protein n=1 Tax=Sporothrix brasiliensis 5110 TaxID=1398154 RepID=A0A0C2J8N3_9PEZI|nr:uncharacterized protein SPBR_04287 [Sporothrix brasiliensis 5110]KIH93342.1 hypothetical protein SPBR_04287 [Sporothrix brasiliensis 5110]
MPDTAQMSSESNSAANGGKTPVIRNAANEIVITSDSEAGQLLKKMLGAGNSGTVIPLPGGTRVQKIVSFWRDDFAIKRQCESLRNEIAIYEYLPKNHRRFAKFLGSSDDGKDRVTIDLEYLPNNTLHEYLRGYTVREFLDTKRRDDEETRADKERRMSRRHDSIPLQQRACWALEAVDGIVALHALNVLHCDIKPENMGLDAQLNVCIFDFAGSSVCGSEPMSMESTRYHKPRNPRDYYGVDTECFALGSSIYHIVTGVRPYDRVPDEEVEDLYARQEFPDLYGEALKDEPLKGSTGNTTPDTIGTSPVTGMLLFADAIRKCWYGEFATSAEILDALKSEVVRTFDEEDLRYISEKSGIELEKEAAGGPAADHSDDQ